MSLVSLPQSFFFLIIGILGISFLIAFHELGHFLFCKLFNIHTPSFSIGFGPRLISKKIGSTEFKISVIPLGGYVEIAGSAEPGQGKQKDANRMDEQSFAIKPFWQKFLVMIGGILFNMAFAYFTFHCFRCRKNILGNRNERVGYWEKVKNIYNFNSLSFNL